MNSLEARIAPREEGEESGGAMKMVAATKLLSSVKKVVSNVRLRREERVGWGLCSRCEDQRGTHRPLGLALFSFVFMVLISTYGLIKHYMLLSRDLRGIRCAHCNLNLAVVYFVTAGAGVLTSLLGIRLQVPDQWSFWPNQKTSHSLSYECVQFIVTMIGIYSWGRAVEDLALIDVPGDPMNLMYIPFGKPNCTRRQPSSRHAPDNPLGLKSRKLRHFHYIECFYIWALTVNALSLGFARILKARTAYRPKLWLCLDFIEMGAFASAAYPRIFDHFGFYGRQVNGYSTFLILGTFRFLRLLRFERLCYCLFSYEGFELSIQKRKVIQLNGVLIRYYLLLLKLVTGFLTVATLVCALEYPCLPNAIRRNHVQIAEVCNPWFRRFDMCLYFLVVTLSTIGYGDMYPATRETKVGMILILLFVLMIMPSLLAELAEYSDGDDCSDSDHIFASVIDLWEELKVIKLKVKRITTKNLHSNRSHTNSPTMTPSQTPMKHQSPLLSLLSETPTKIVQQNQDDGPNQKSIEEIYLLVKELETQVDQIQQNATANRELVGLLNHLANIVVAKGLRLQGSISRPSSTPLPPIRT